MCVVVITYLSAVGMITDCTNSLGKLSVNSGACEALGNYNYQCELGGGAHTINLAQHNYPKYSALM